jgi:serine/threonine protein phosphatase PrpC
MPVVECFAASRPQDGRSANEDAFLLAPQAGPPWVAICDGAGHAQQAARRALRLFERLIAEADSQAVALFPTWARWAKTLDSALLGGTQSTFLAVAVLDGRVAGVCVGDSRAYLWTRDGELRILTEGASKFRLGSGSVEPFPIHAPLARGDVVLLLTDGAWTPLSLHGLQRLVASAALGGFADLPGRILDAAGRSGRADDMTAVACRLRG